MWKSCVNGSINCPEAGLTIVATGPLTAQNLAESIIGTTGQDRLAFFDAIAPNRSPRQH